MPMENCMSPELVRRLISGEFICPITASDAHAQLSDEKRREEVDAYLRVMGLRVASTPEGSAYYAANVNWDDAARRDVKAAFAGVKNEIRFVVEFLQALLGMTGVDMLLTPGYVIHKNKLADIISSSPAWRDQLRSLAATLKNNSADSGNSVLVGKLLRRMADLGYFQLTNAQDEIYRVTGKIDWFHQVVAFVVEHENIPDIEEDDAPTGHLI